MTIAERSAKGANIHDFAQGLWWSVETVTTVGYGDRYPTTPFGQGVAALLMLVGIGLIGTLTATVASYFVQEKANASDERLERIEMLLAQLLGDANKPFVHVNGHLGSDRVASSSANGGGQKDGTTQISAEPALPGRP